jgi:hypothetical protein
MNGLNEIIAAICNGMVNTDEASGMIYEMAYIAACEQCGPNSHEFQAVLERLFDDYSAHVAEELGG